jgi:hypothetical protein
MGDFFTNTYGHPGPYSDFAMAQIQCDQSKKYLLRLSKPKKTKFQFTKIYMFTCSTRLVNISKDLYRPPTNLLRYIKVIN